MRSTVQSIAAIRHLPDLLVVCAAHPNHCLFLSGGWPRRWTKGRALRASVRPCGAASLEGSSKVKNSFWLARSAQRQPSRAIGPADSLEPGLRVCRSRFGSHGPGIQTLGDQTPPPGPRPTTRRSAAFGLGHTPQFCGSWRGAFRGAAARGTRRASAGRQTLKPRLSSGTRMFVGGRGGRGRDHPPSLMCGDGVFIFALSLVDGVAVLYQSRSPAPSTSPAVLFCGDQFFPLAMAGLRRRSAAHTGGWHPHARLLRILPLNLNIGHCIFAEIRG
jgi:hypothetical protein